MAHEIHGEFCVYSNNHGGVPWHGIGTALDVVSADDVRTFAGFNRRIAALPITLDIGHGTMAHPAQAAGMAESIEGYRATVDLSNGRVLGVVTERYAVLQPDELLAAAEFLVREFGARYSLAAQLREGKREIISLSMPDTEGEVACGDKIKSYFNLANGHDGKLAVCVGSSDIRVVCANTLSAWLSEKGAVSIRHRDGVERALARSVAAFKLEAEARRMFYTRMSERKMAPSEVIAYFDVCLGESEKISAVAKRGRKSLRARLDALVMSGGLIGIDTHMMLPNNLWGAYNAITQVATHESYSSRPLDNLYFGAGGKLLGVANQQAQALLAA